ncbi:mitochondrial outer membrane protein porin 2-like [Gossypium australe]|uniref:Mitochondrial outer membrane protein porin 2-like n=1 Tax=Gossypium australe TaxID=47621 RepID=A0A5B6VZ10_9ROSI|nr:mitochondrial outer membrane protein porin 2-like [Gossypium australe]
MLLHYTSTRIVNSMSKLTPTLTWVLMPNPAERLTLFFQISTTLTFTEILPSTKTIASFKVPDYNSSKLEVQYFHDHATVTTTVGLNQTPDVDVTATIGTPTITFGAEAGYDTTSGNFTKYTAVTPESKPVESGGVWGVKCSTLIA